MAEEIKEEPKAEVIETPTPIAEPEKIIEPTTDSLKEENERLKADKKRLLDEHSSLGRKVKYIEDELSNKYDRIIKELENRKLEPKNNEIVNDEPIDITDLISDPTKLDAHISKVAEKKLLEKEQARLDSERKKSEQSTVYEKNLYSELYELMKDDPDKQLIEDELLAQKFTPSGNANVDAERFFLKAQSNVLRRKLPESKTNQFKKNDTVPKISGTGVGGNSPVTKRTAVMPELGEQAKAYLKRIGKLDDAEFVMDAINSKRS